MAGMKGKAADGIDGGFAEDDGARIIAGGNPRRDGEVSVVFTGTRSHAAPRNGAGSAKFGSHGGVAGFFSKEEEDNVCFVVGVKCAGGDEGIE